MNQSILCTHAKAVQNPTHGKALGASVVVAVEVSYTLAGNLLTELAVYHGGMLLRMF